MWCIRVITPWRRTVLECGSARALVQILQQTTEPMKKKRTYSLAALFAAVTLTTLVVAYVAVYVVWWNQLGQPWLPTG